MESSVLKSITTVTKDGEWGKGEPFDSSVEMAVIRGTDFEDARVGLLDGVPSRHISEHIAIRKRLQAFDILIETAGGSKDRPTGRTLLVKPSLISKSALPLTCASFARFIRIDQQKANPAFVFWFLQYLYNAGLILQYHTQHTGVARFQFTTFAEREPLPLPPINVQERIASILSAYDDLIENNTRRINILEEMAQMLYREWFVNFRFPGHENVKMIESELGPIPEGWESRRVPEAVHVDPPTKVPKEGMKPFVPMGSLSDNLMLINDVEEREGNSGAKFKNGDTLFARITPCLENGKTGFVQSLPSDDAVGFGSTEFIVLRSKSLCPEYVYLMARSSEFRDNAIKSMSGATGRQRVQDQCFERFFIAQPDAGTLDKFQSFTAPMFRLIYSLNLKNSNLRTTRDFLLPKLISGEIPVEAADHAAAELIEQTA